MSNLEEKNTKRPLPKFSLRLTAQARKPPSSVRPTQPPMEYIHEVANDQAHPVLSPSNGWTKGSIWSRFAPTLDPLRQSLIDSWPLYMVSRSGKGEVFTDSLRAEVML